MSTPLWTRLSNPSHFMRWSGTLVQWLAAISTAILAIGLYL